MSITPTNEPKRGRNWGKGTRAGVEKKGKEVKRKKKVEFGLQERVNGLRWGRICALLPGYMTASPFHLPHAGPPCLGCTGPLVGRCQGQTQWQDVQPSPGSLASERELRNRGCRAPLEEVAVASTSEETRCLPWSLPPTPQPLPSPAPGPFQPFQNESKRPPQEQREEKGKGDGVCV